MNPDGTLEQAMQHEDNNIPDILNDIAQTPETLRLSRDRGGLICDPRPGHTERNASFSIGVKNGASVWHRFGGDNASGNAFSLLIALGFSKRQAAEYLIQRAGLSNISPFPRAPRAEIKQSTATEKAEPATGKFKPLSPQERERANRLARPVRDGEHAALEIVKRGIGNAQAVFRTLKNDYAAHGRTLALAGALAFSVTNPSGQVWAVKVRNPGTEYELKARGVARYVYLIAGHGSPPWCSLDDREADTVVLVEGEFNAMVLSSVLGSRFAVQGVAGAGAVPYLGSLKDRHALLYADDDQPGLDAVNRWGMLALENGAKSVRVLEPLAYPNDFCDVHATLGEWFNQAFDQAKPFDQPFNQAKTPLEKTPSSTAFPFVHPSNPLGDGYLVKPFDPLAKYQRKMALLTRGAR
jgi:hypothetical protein